MKMVCRKPNRYGNKSRAFGDEVEVNRHDVRLVKALGWFAPYEDPPKAQPAQKVQAKSIDNWATQPARKAAPKPRALPDDERVPLLPEDPPPQPTWVGAGSGTAADADDAKPKGTYKRRDLRAED